MIYNKSIYSRWYVKVAWTAVTPTTKTLTYNSVSNGVYSYTLTLKWVSSDGALTLTVAANKVADNAWNNNVATTVTPGVTIDNTAPTLSANNSWSWKTSDITITLSVWDTWWIMQNIHGQVQQIVQVNEQVLQMEHN